jgi:hypothetical protein
MRIVVIVLLLLGAQFVLTAFAPAAAGKAWLLWPFAEDSKPWLNAIGGLPKEGGSAVTPLLAGIAGLCFLAAVLALLGWFVPSDWFRPLVLAATVAALLLNGLYLGIWAIAPIVIDLVLLWGVFFQSWSVTALRGP